MGIIKQIPVNLHRFFLPDPLGQTGLYFSSFRNFLKDNKRSFFHVVLPPQLLPAPAVQPKQCFPMTISLFNKASLSKSLICTEAQKTWRSSIWLKSQSYR